MTDLSRLSPLHRAVIANDAEALAKHMREGHSGRNRDPLGFTPLEVAELLGRQECQLLLGGKSPSSIWWQDKHQNDLKLLSVATFEKHFALTYRPFLFFSSYERLEETINNCPYVLRYAWLATDNHGWATKYKKELESGTLAPVSIRWIDEIFGYGVFAEADLSAGTFIGEYTGLVRRLYRKKADQNAYCLQYPTRFWSLKYTTIDALSEGNLMRFINHSERPNIEPLCLVDRGLLHQAFIALQGIKKGQQLTFNYGQDYWLNRPKH